MQRYFGRQDACRDKRTEESNYRFRELLSGAVFNRGITLPWNYYHGIGITIPVMIIKAEHFCLKFIIFKDALSVRIRRYFGSLIVEGGVSDILIKLFCMICKGHKILIIN